jgi:8-oxo-dGTP diphosphatase
MTDKKRLHRIGKMIAACEVYIVHGEEVLMHKRSTDKKKFPGYWIGPGGHIDAGEDALSAAIREVREETGVLINETDIKLNIDRGEVWMEYLFRARIPKKQLIENTKEGSSEWLKIDKILSLENVFPPSRYYFDHILNDKPGIMYNASEWKEAKLVRVLSEKVDKDS